MSGKNSEKPLLPAHLRELAVDIPRTWTPEEALAVFELIDDLREKNWTLYACQMQASLRGQSANNQADASDRPLDQPSPPSA